MLSPDDPNYEMYADQINYDSSELDNGDQIRYYVKIAEELKIEEKRTMYVDFSHMSTFAWEDGQFIDRLQTEYIRFEPYLR